MFTALVLTHVLSAVGDGGPSDWGAAITTAFTGMGPALIAVAATGLAIGVTIWGFPKAVAFFKKTAK